MVGQERRLTPIPPWFLVSTMDGTRKENIPPPSIYSSGDYSAACLLFGLLSLRTQYPYGIDMLLFLLCLCAEKFISKCTVTVVP